MAPPNLMRCIVLGAVLAIASPAQSLAQTTPVTQVAPMIHMFVIRLNDGVTATQKAEAVARIRDLQGKVPGLLETSVGLNVSPRGQGYDLAGSMRFADGAALAAYNDHPAHQALLAWLGPLVQTAIEADF